MGTNNRWSSSRIGFGSTAIPPIYHLYINDLPKTINEKTVPILFADNTSIIVKNSNQKDFQTNMTMALTVSISGLK